MTCYIVYYKDHAIVVHGRKPTQHEYPTSQFAEGPFKKIGDAIARLRWMGRL